MTNIEWWIVAGNGLAAAVLINAGLAKLAFPRPLSRALSEVLPVRRSAATAQTTTVPASTAPAAATTILIPTAIPRGFALLEVTAGVALLIPGTRLIAAGAATVLGVLFAGLGTLGWLRRSTVPCGCLGTHGDRPLGGRNVLIGLALAAVFPFNRLAAPEGEGSGDYASWAPLTASLLMLVLCLWAYRELAWRLLARTGAARSHGNG